MAENKYQDDFLEDDESFHLADFAEPHLNQAGLDVRVAALKDAVAAAETRAALQFKIGRAAHDAIDDYSRLLDKEKKKKTPPKTSNIRTLDSLSTDAEIRKARLRQAIRIDDDVYLPYIPPDCFSLPHTLIRSAFFPTASRNEEGLVGARIPVSGDATIIYTGPCLVGYDRQVLAAVIKLVADNPLASDAGSPWMTATLLSLAKMLKKSPGLKVYQAILESLNRLSSVQLSLRISEVNLELPHLIEVEEVVESKKREVKIRLPAGFAEMFGQNSWSRLPEAYLQFNEGYTGWITAFFCSHAKSYPLDIEHLYRLSGSVGGLPEFRRKLRKALAVLRDTEVPDDVRIEGWDYDKKTDKITVFKSCWQELKT